MCSTFSKLWEFFTNFPGTTTLFHCLFARLVMYINLGKQVIPSRAITPKSTLMRAAAFAQLLSSSPRSHSSSWQQLETGIAEIFRKSSDLLLIG